ncbi:hypothetical protein AOLI_G00150860 [Acnodon oligacanthus]
MQDCGRTSVREMSATGRKAVPERSQENITKGGNSRGLKMTAKPTAPQNVRAQRTTPQQEHRDPTAGRRNAAESIPQPLTRENFPQAREDAATPLTPIQPRVRGPRAKTQRPSVLHMSTNSAPRRAKLAQPPWLQRPVRTEYPQREKRERGVSSPFKRSELGSPQRERAILLRELTEKLSVESCLLPRCGPAGSGSLPNHDGELGGGRTASLAKFRPWLRGSAPFVSCAAFLSAAPRSEGDRPPALSSPVESAPPPLSLSASLPPAE